MAARQVASTGSAAAAGLEHKVDMLVQQMAELSRQNAALLDEVRELRRENERLRQGRDAAAGRQVHEPYAGGPVGPVPPTPGPEAAAEFQLGSPRTPRPPTTDVIMDTHSPEGQPPESKRARPTADPAHNHA